MPSRETLWRIGIAAGAAIAAILVVLDLGRYGLFDVDYVLRILPILTRGLVATLGLVAVVTIATHGYGVETSLAVESVRVPASHGPRDLFRSGVHPKADIAAALAALEEG